MPCSTISDLIRVDDHEVVRQACRRRGSLRQYQWERGNSSMKISLGERDVQYHRYF